MDKIVQRLKAYIDTHPLDLGEGDCETVLDQLYQSYAESHESDPPEIRESFRELDELLGALPLDDNAVEETQVIKKSVPGVIITIAREHGSSGKQIGKLVAEKLGICVYPKTMLVTV